MRLSSLSAPELSSPLISDLLKVTGIDPQLVEECILGQVLTAGVGQAPARQASRKGGCLIQCVPPQLAGFVAVVLKP